MSLGRCAQERAQHAKRDQNAGSKHSISQHDETYRTLASPCASLRDYLELKPVIICRATDA